MPAEFKVKLRRVGLSLVISIPTPAHTGLGWSEGDILSLIVGDKEIVITKAKAKAHE